MEQEKIRTGCVSRDTKKFRKGSQEAFQVKKLPIGIQSFKIMREDEYYYVDKTPFIKKLVDEGRYYFLSRPRRFGKSLFLDTLRWAFLGKKEYFKGLYLEQNWDWSDRYPVVHVSFGVGVMRTVQDLRDRLESILIDLKNEHDIQYEKKGINNRFLEAIAKISAKEKKPVVILVDEYDKPVLDQIDNPRLAMELREELKNFYSVIKEADQYLKFVFISGVSKFSKVSLFGGLNNLQDITLNPKYATICGYTQKELEQVFADRLANFDLDEIKKWYDGYRWLGEPVYNPFDVLLFLSEKNFRAFWFETGTPTFLISLVNQKKYYIPQLEQLQVTERILGSFDVGQIELETLLFQTGYLTIDRSERKGSRLVYLLTYPNTEVKISLTDYFLEHFTNNLTQKEKNITKLYDLLTSNDFTGLMELFRSFFASIPYDWYRKNQLAQYEGYYASIFYCYFTASGMTVRAEDMTNHGKIDLTVFFKGRCYIFEFKVIELVPSGSALQQLKTKRYHEKYRANHDEIYLIGVEFSKEDRNIVNFEVERVT